MRIPKFCLFASMILSAWARDANALDVGVQFDKDRTTASILLTHVPAGEPLGAVKIRLKPRPGSLSDFVNIRIPPGPWGQIAPELDWAGSAMTIWAIAPNIGESRDSASQLIATLNVGLAPGKQFSAAADLIDSVIVLEAYAPSGAKISLRPGTLTTALRPIGPAAAAPADRILGASHTLTFTLAKAQRVRIFVSDPRGRRMAGILDRKLGPGMHEAIWDGKGDGGRSLPSGTYFLRLDAGAYAYNHRLEVSP